MSGLGFLYGTAAGRALLRPLVGRPLSKLAGRFLETRVSKGLIGPFVRKNRMDLSDYDLRDLNCFNDFFCRPLKSGRRIVDPDPAALIAPCDGLLTAVRVDGDTVLPVKQSRYSLARLLGDEALAAAFEDGLCLVFRLCVEHYHRYCYFADGRKGENVFLPGALHTVRPVALADVPVFTENCREYTVMETERFGRAVQMEVGAMLVGRIVNDHLWPRDVKRGEEKGHFAFGGSTVIVLLQKGSAELLPALLEASARGEETPVRMGQRIGAARTSF
jgi:phosphatidylserine decarboxylase